MCFQQYLIVDLLAMNTAVEDDEEAELKKLQASMAM
jgi:hypothetical protein